MALYVNKERRKPKIKPMKNTGLVYAHLCTPTTFPHVQNYTKPDC